METYLERIKKIKNEKRITNEQLSEQTGIPLGTLSKILVGLSDSPKVSNMVAICSALGCSLSYVMTGIPDNTNNYTLTEGEIRLVELFRSLDTHGREMVSLVLDKEHQRMSQNAILGDRVLHMPQPEPPKKPSRKVSHPSAEPISSEYKVLPLYQLPVSAGPGEFLDASTAERINVPLSKKTTKADYALRINGNSMEPKYHDGDILLIEECNSVDVGELGIFILDGFGFFKQYAGDRLVSLNPEYDDIYLGDYEEIMCCGKVIGSMRRRPKRPQPVGVGAAL